MYQALSKKVEIIVEEILKLNAINFQSVSSRTKTVGSYRKKARRGNTQTHAWKSWTCPVYELLPIRSKTKKAAGIIKNAFRIYPQHKC